MSEITFSPPLGYRTTDSEFKQLRTSGLSPGDVIGFDDDLELAIITPAAPGTIESTTNLLAGDGAGAGVDSGIDPADVAVTADLAGMVVTADLAAYVPITREINSHFLDGDINLTTGDVNEIADRNYVSDAELTALAGISGTNTGDQDAAGVAYDNDDSGLTATDVQAAIDEVYASISAPVGAVPIGSIIMWSGTVATIPGGYALCDGTANSPGPDLRDKFIVGAKQDDSGIAKTNLTGALTQSGSAAASAHSLGTSVAVSAHSLGTSVAISDHTLTTSVAIAAHTLTTDVALSAHTLDTNVAIANHTLDTSGRRTSSAATVAADTTTSLTHTITQPVVAAHSITQPVVSEHSITQPVVSAHSITQPVVSDHSITQPVVSDHSSLWPTFYALALIQRMS